jgi:glucose-1-phosphatase
MIRDILFDLGNVLTPLDWEIAYRRLLPHLPADKARLLNEERPAFVELFQEPATALECGKLSFKAFYNTMAKILGIRMDETDFRYIWCDIFRMNEEVVALGESLSENYGTWLLSNTNEAHYKWIMEKFPRVAFFKDAALSFEVGVMKPSKRFYEKAVGRFGIDPPTSVFIDDLEENVQGAIRAGMHSVLFRNSKLLIQDLQEIGVKLPDSQE